MTICEKKGHKFEARYNENPAMGSKIDKASMSARELRELFYYKTYIHDICVRCGKVIKRGEG